MQTYFILGLLIMWSAGLTAAAPVPQDQVTTASAAASLPPQNVAPRMSQQQLDELVGPIALYPDVLLAQVLAASTYPLDVIEADRWLKANKKDTTKIDEQNWDPSVRAVARYPQVIAMMSEKIPWLRQLGDAVLNQQPDVMDAVQRSRAAAQQTGALKSDQAQKVEESGNVILIQPANPQVIYVPVYEPQAVYSSPYDYSYQYAYPYGNYDDFYYSSPIRYYPPVYCGGWLDMDCDWNGRSLYYGGWGFRHGFCDDDDFYRRHHRRFDHDYYGSDHRGRDFGRYANRWQHDSRDWTRYASYSAPNRIGRDYARNANPGRMSRELASRNSRYGAGDRMGYQRDSNDILGFVGPRSSGRDLQATDRGNTGFTGARMNRRLSSPPSERNFIPRSQSASLIRSSDAGNALFRDRINVPGRSGMPEGIRQFGIRPNRAYRGFGTEWNTGVGGGRSLNYQNPMGRGSGAGGIRRSDTFVGPRGPVLGRTQGGGSRGYYSAPYLGGYGSRGPVYRGGSSIRGSMSMRGPVAGGGRNYGRSPNRR